MLTTLLIIFIASFLAFSISAICGGGAGLMLIPILGSLLPVNQVPAALSIGTFTSSASRLVVFKKNICWPIVKYFVPAALPAVWLGACLLQFVTPVYLELAMGVFLVSNVFFLFKKNKASKQTKKPSNFILATVGFSAGFLSGLTGAVGLLFNGFYLQYGLTKEEVVATRAANEIILHLVKIVLYFMFGLIVMKVIYIGIVVAVSAVLSTWAMKWVLPKFSDGLFKKTGYFAMVFSGLFMLSKASAEVLDMHNGKIEFSRKEKGLNAQLSWHDQDFALEFEYDKGFEFEQIIPLDQLSLEHQKLVASKGQNADNIVVEVVYKIGSKSYEAYYFSNDELIDKIHFK